MHESIDLREPHLMLGAAAPELRGARRFIARASFPMTRRRVVAAFGIESSAIEHAYAEVAVDHGRIGAET